MKLADEIELEDLVFSGSSIDYKTVYVVRYSLIGPQVNLSKVDLMKVQRRDNVAFGDYIHISGFEWDGTKKDHLDINVHQDEDFQTKFFRTKRAAEKYLTYARLKGFNILDRVAATPKRELKVIKLKN